MNLLSDITFSPVLRYEAHQLVYTPVDKCPVVLTGIMGAALLAVLLVDTDEGNARGIALDTDERREQFYQRYERDVLRDDWGYLAAEVEQLRNSYVELSVSNVELSGICTNTRLLDMAIGLIVTYMRRLTAETYGEHIWERCPWRAPFSQWLYDASCMETRRQRYRHADWTDAPQVNALADLTDSKESPTLSFEGEEADQIMRLYLEWLADEYVLMKKELPGAKITSADRNYIISQETDWAYLSDEIGCFSEDEQKQWNHWMSEWSDYITGQLKPQQEIRFWRDDVPQNVREHLLYRLRLVERHPAHFRDLTTSVYAMRLLGYVRRKLSDKAIRQWLSENLSIDYTTRSNASQFQRAMKEHGRYTPEVQDEVAYLESLGFFRFEPTDAHEQE